MPQLHERDRFGVDDASSRVAFRRRRWVMRTPLGRRYGSLSSIRNDRFDRQVRRRVKVPPAQHREHRTYGYLHMHS